jgi:hypothetical protein
MSVTWLAKVAFHDVTIVLTTKLILKLIQTYATSPNLIVQDNRMIYCRTRLHFTLARRFIQFALQVGCRDPASDETPILD